VPAVAFTVTGTFNERLVNDLLPLGLPDSRYAVTLSLTVKQRGARTDKLLSALRRERHTKILGPDQNGRVTVEDSEASAGEARTRLISSLDALDWNWPAPLELPPAAGNGVSYRDRRRAVAALRVYGAAGGAAACGSGSGPGSS